MKKIYDVSIPITKDMVLWPDDPGIKMERSQKIEEGSASNVTELTMGLHTGTHIDAPYHFVEQGDRIEDIPLEQLIGTVKVIEIPDTYKDISMEAVKNCMLDKQDKRVLFKTRNSKSWHIEKNFVMDYVAVDFDCAKHLVKVGVKLVGIDYLSIAPFNDIVRVHRLFLNAGVIIIEGLDLCAVHPGNYKMCCLPLKMIGVEASPARIVLIED